MNPTRISSEKMFGEIANKVDKDTKGNASQSALMIAHGPSAGELKRNC